MVHGSVDYATIALTDAGESIQPDNRFSPKRHFHAVDLQFVKQLFRLLKLSSQRSKVPRFFAVLFISLAFGELASYFVGLLPSQFYQVLLGKSTDPFFKLVIKSLVLVTLAALMKALSKYASGLLAIAIRGELTIRAQNMYVLDAALSPGVFRKVDNPDQRITQDIYNLSEVFAGLCEKLLLSPLMIIYYSIQCWKVGGWHGPLIIYLNFVISVIVSRLLMTPLARAVFQQEFAEGNFRYGHVHVRDAADEIRLLRGYNAEERILEKLLLLLLRLQRRVISCRLRLEVFADAVSYFGSILSYLIIAIPVFAGNYDNATPAELGSIISKNSFLSMYLIFKFSIMFDEASNVSNLAGFVARLTGLLEACEESCFTNKSQKLRVTSNEVILENMDIEDPQGTVLVPKFSFIFKRNEDVVIKGPNGAGKTSLLRNIASLVDAHDNLMILSQRPYFCHGSMRDQLVYPKTMETVSDGELMEALRLVGLKVDNDFHEEYRPDEWTTRLSPGERQKLCFARVFVQKPEFIFADEATSWMDKDSASRLFDECRARGITVVLVSHDLSMQERFKRSILFEKGQYKIS